MEKDYSNLITSIVSQNEYKVLFTPTVEERTVIKSIVEEFRLKKIDSDVNLKILEMKVQEIQEFLRKINVSGKLSRDLENVQSLLQRKDNFDFGSDLSEIRNDFFKLQIYES